MFCLRTVGIEVVFGTTCYLTSGNIGSKEFCKLTCHFELNVEIVLNDFQIWSGTYKFCTCVIALGMLTLSIKFLVTFDYIQELDT